MNGLEVSFSVVCSCLEGVGTPEASGLGLSLSVQEFVFVSSL